MASRRGMLTEYLNIFLWLLGPLVEIALMVIEKIIYLISATIFF